MMDKAIADGIRSAFESLKGDFREDRLPAVASRISGESALWGEHLLAVYAGEGRAELEQRDPLTRFWVLRFRGMPKPADMSGAPPGAVFVIAFTSFPYLDAMTDMWTLGEPVGQTEDGRLALQLLIEGVAEEGRVLVAEANPLGGWRFDLMPLYVEKAGALDRFVNGHFEGDFERFMRQYVADHDLLFDFDQAWKSVARD
jgi:hypothetical protein